jgi:hypothetical protein
MTCLERVKVFLDPRLQMVYAARDFNQRFWSLVRKFGLEGKVEMRINNFPPNVFFALFRIVEDEEERHISLPDRFVEQVRNLVMKSHPDVLIRPRGRGVSFTTEAGKTMDEIRRAQEAWRSHCDNFWICA